MDLRKLKTLIDLVSESGIAELEITEGEGKVRSVGGVDVPVRADAICVHSDTPNAVAVAQAVRAAVKAA